MKGFIFAAGIGSRLKPFTQHHPKALVEVGGKPMLLHVIDRMLEAGISDITINTHHFSQQIVDYVSSLSKDALFHISDESQQLLDTGGGLLHAASFIDGEEPLLIHNADILSDIDFHQLLKCHESSNADATLAVQPYRKSSRMLFYDSTNMLSGWENIATGETRPTGFSPDGYTSCAFSGVHIITPSRVIPTLRRYALSHGNVFSIIPFYLDKLSSLSVSTCSLSENTQWHDIGKPETLEAARRHFHLNS